MNAVRTTLALLVVIPAVAMAQADPSTPPNPQSGATQLSPEVARKLQDDKTALSAARAQLRTDREAAGFASALLLGAPAADVATACPTLDVPVRVQQQIVAKAEQGVDALRQFVTISEPTLQLDIQEVVDWLDARRDAMCS